MKLIGDQLRAIMPRCKDAETSAVALSVAMGWAKINTVTRAAAFLGQIAHESGELRYLEEIADGSAYEGRRDLGNTQPGDGPRYKGRGWLQLTGRANYRKAGEALGEDLESDPALAAGVTMSARVAAWYWETHGCNELADKTDFRGITKRINGGYNGLEHRRRYYYRALEVLGVGAVLG